MLRRRSFLEKLFYLPTMFWRHYRIFRKYCDLPSSLRLAMRFSMELFR